MTKPHTTKIAMESFKPTANYILNTDYKNLPKGTCIQIKNVIDITPMNTGLYTTNSAEIRFKAYYVSDLAMPTFIDSEYEEYLNTLYNEQYDDDYDYEYDDEYDDDYCNVYDDYDEFLDNAEYDSKSQYYINNYCGWQYSINATTFAKMITAYTNTDMSIKKDKGFYESKSTNYNSPFYNSRKLLY